MGLNVTKSDRSTLTEIYQNRMNYVEVIAKIKRCKFMTHLAQW